VDDQGAAIKTILNETERLRYLVEDLLYLSRLDTDEEMYRFAELDFGELLQHVTARMKILAEKEKIDISLTRAEDDILLRGDEEKLVRAITNVVSNCLRFAAAKIAVQVTLMPDPGNKHLRLTICDDGPGFDQDDLDNIFTRFYKGKNGKFGLGLAIAKSIIDKHGGSITARNNENGGACFEIFLVPGV